MDEERNEGWQVAALRMFAEHGCNPAYGGVPLTKAQAAASFVAEQIEQQHQEIERFRGHLRKSVQCHDYLCACIHELGGLGASCPANEESRLLTGETS